MFKFDQNSNLNELKTRNQFFVIYFKDMTNVNYTGMASYTIYNSASPPIPGTFNLTMAPLDSVNIVWQQSTIPPNFANMVKTPIDLYNFVSNTETPNLYTAAYQSEVSISGTVTNPYCGSLTPTIVTLTPYSQPNNTTSQT